MFQILMTFLNRQLSELFLKNFVLFIVLMAMFSACSEERKPASVMSKTDTQSENESASQEEPSPVSATVAVNNGPIRFYFTPSVDERIVREKGGDLLKFLSNETGLVFEIHITKNYDDMILDFENSKADVAIMNSLSYIKANERCGATARLRAIRYGKSTYFGQIIAREGKGINSIADLSGKTIAYTDSLSTSGYLFPQKILAQSGVKPGKILFAGKHDEVVKMVYNGKVDAGATFYSEPAADGTIRDARARLLDKYPDIAQKVKIITITEPIPNDPVVFRKDLSSDAVYKISLGLIKYLSTNEGKNVLTAIYSTEGFIRCSDADYDILRAAIK